MKKSLLFICLGLSLMLAFAGCKKTETLEVEPVEQVEVVETEEETEVELTEPEEEIVLSWAEENGISFSTDKEYSGPVFAVFTSDREGRDLVDIISYSDMKSSCGLTDISISDSDEEGYVVYTITCDSKTSFSRSYDDQDEYPDSGSNWWGVLEFIPIDYYTGTVYPSKPNEIYFENGEKTDSDDFAITTEVSFEGENYLVSVSQNREAELETSEWTDIGNGKWEQTYNYSQTTVYTIKIPQEYDGLVLAISKSDLNYIPVADEPEYYDAYVLGSDDDPNEKDLSEYNYIRVSDIIKDFENADSEDSNE